MIYTYHLTVQFEQFTARRSLYVQRSIPFAKRLRATSMGGDP